MGGQNANTEIEERVTALERELQELKKVTSNTVPWYEKIAGTFADSTDYEEAMSLGRKYRESLRPKGDTSMR